MITLDDEYGIVHWISKEARYKIIELLLTTRSVRQLANELGVSATAVKKYIERKTHPSDATMIKLLTILAPYEQDKVYELIINDLFDALTRLIELIGDNERLLDMVREKLKEVELFVEQR